MFPNKTFLQNTIRGEDWQLLSGSGHGCSHGPGLSLCLMMFFLTKIHHQSTLWIKPAAWFLFVRRFSCHPWSIQAINAMCPHITTAFAWQRGVGEGHQRRTWIYNTGFVKNIIIIYCIRTAFFFWHCQGEPAWPFCWKMADWSMPKWAAVRSGTPLLFVFQMAKAGFAWPCCAVTKAV